MGEVRRGKSKGQSKRGKSGGIPEDIEFAGTKPVVLTRASDDC